MRVNVSLKPGGLESVGANQVAALDARQPLASQVADRLREWIVHGELAPGQRVVERTLCRRLDVSRTPFREALKILQGEGLVELALNKGARVAIVTPELLDDLFRVLASLEGLAAELAVQRATDAEVERLETLHERMIEDYVRANRRSYFDLNSAIHDLVVDMSGNLALITAREKLVGQERRGRYLAIGNHDRWDRSVAEHEDLISAFRRRDAAAAGRVWSAHLLGTGAHLTAPEAGRTGSDKPLSKS